MFGGNYLPKEFIFHSLTDKQRQILAAGDVVGVGEAVGIFEQSAGEAYSSAFFVHETNKLVEFIAFLLFRLYQYFADGEGQGDGGVVATGEHESVEEVFD